MTVRLAALLALLVVFAGCGEEAPVQGLVDAAGRGDVEAVRSLLDDGADVDAARRPMGARRSPRRRWAMTSMSRAC